MVLLSLEFLSQVLRTPVLLSAVVAAEEAVSSELVVEAVEVLELAVDLFLEEVELALVAEEEGEEVVDLVYLLPVAVLLGEACTLVLRSLEYQFLVPHIPVLPSVAEAEVAEEEVLLPVVVEEVVAVLLLAA